jgi:L-lysine exporter family protein LysE/ArgO
MEFAYLAGLALGLALILPIGAQNVFVVGQGLAVGWPRAGWAVVAAACCDTLLIVVGAAGVSGLLAGFPAVRGVLLLGGVAFLGYLGVRSWRDATGAERLHAGAALRPGRVVRRTVAVSLLNPHAILDTVGVIGAAVAAQPSGSRALFAFGTVTASWLWFLLLAGGAAGMRRYLTPGRARWFERISGSVMLVFAALLLGEFVQLVIR